jgi:XTP/dITP diphosphohydrolase
LARIVLASRNKGKIRELHELLAESGIAAEVLSLADFPELPEIEEDGATFQENAMKKATIVTAATGLITLADDSGLEVDVLGGQPGVMSARFAGLHGNDRANNALLLDRLQGVAENHRTARFRCAIAIAAPDGMIETCDGFCEGVIGFAPKGEGGFGYDPLFFIPEQGMTMAELPEGIKNRISHRAKAMQKAIAIIPGFLRDYSGTAHNT